MNPTPEATEFAYDILPYLGHAYPQTHPDRLAVLAALHGMRPAPANACRVLELACGDGGNLIPMAQALPGSHFLGVDLAETAIAKGKAVVEALVLANISLRQGDLMDFPDGAGDFDYIIAHGLYSWVPAPVRDRVMAICARHLAPQGVAFISYNCLPGYHFRVMAREMMRYHARDEHEPARRVQAARDLMRFLVAAQTRPGPYKDVLAEQLERVLKRDDFALYHDELADVNASLYFHEFAAHAARHGLRFLSEAEHADAQATGLAPATIETLAGIGREDPLAREQYLDFIKNRAFRQTLLCHAEIDLMPTPDPDRIKTCHFSTGYRPAPGEPSNMVPGKEARFIHPTHADIKTNHPSAKAVITLLARQWPARPGFSDVLVGARQLLKSAGGAASIASSLDEAGLTAVLMSLYDIGGVQVHAMPAPLVITPGPRPTVSGLARLQAGQGAMLTALNHMTVELRDDMARALVRLCDGTRDRRAILDGLRRHAADAKDRKAVLAGLTPSTLEQNLGTLGRMGLLQA